MHDTLRMLAQSGRKFVTASWIVMAFAACDGAGRTASDAYDAGVKAFESGELAQAAIHLKSALQQDKRLLDARALLGRVYLLSGDPVTAAKEYEQLIDDGRDDAGTMLDYAEALLALGRFDEALAIAEAHSSKAAGQVLMARAQLGLAHYEAAGVAFRKAQEDPEQAAAAFRGLARLALLEEDWAAAATFVESAESATPQAVETCLLSGQVAYARGELEKATAVYTDCLELDPYESSASRANAHAGLATLALSQEQPEVAAAHIDYLLRANAEHPGYRYLRAMQLFQQDRFEKAKGLLQENLSVAPNHTDSLALAGVVEYRLDNRNQAREFLERALVSRPESYFIRKSLGSLYLQLGLHQEALDMLEPLARASPDDAELSQLLGAAYLANNMTDAATEAFNRTLEIAPQAVDARAGLAMSHLARNDIGQTIAELENAVEENPEFAQGEYLIAVARFKDGQLDEALASTESLIEKNPGVAAYHNLLGTVQQARGETVKARSAFRKALAEQPDYALAGMNLAALEVAAGNWDDARETFEKILEQRPDHGRALNGLAVVHLVAGDTQAAAAQWERARAANSQDLQARLRLGEVYFDQGRFKDGIAVIEEALSLAPDHPAALLIAARLRLIEGELEVARRHARKLLEIAPDSYQANYINALVDIRYGDFDEGKARLERALAIAPESTTARQLLEGLADSMGLSLPPAMIDPDKAVSVDEKVRRYLRADDPGRALALAREHAQANESDVRAQFLLAGTHMALQEFDAARTILDGVLEADPGNVAAMMNFANLERMAGEEREARAWYGKVLAKQPDNEDALLQLAALSPEEEAADLVRRAHANNPSSDRTMMALAKHELERGNFSAAEPLVEKLYKRAPMEPEILNLAVRTYLGAGKMNKAAESADQYAEHYPENADALVLRAMVYLARGDRDTARAPLERAIELDSRNVGAMLLLAELEFASGNLTRAETLLERIHGLDYRTGQTERLQGDVAWRSGDQSAALSAYRRAWDLEPVADYAISLARALWASGDVEEGRALLVSALEREPANVSMREALADMFYAEENYDRAAEAYRQVLEADPEEALVMDKLAEVYELAGDKRALTTAQKAHELLPDHVETQSTYGWLLVQDGGTQQGLSLLRKAVSQLDNIADPSARATIRFQLAEALRKSGQREAAREELERLLSSNVAFPERELAERLLNR